MENNPTPRGPKPQKDKKQLRLTRSIALNDYEYEGLKLLADRASAKSIGAYVVAKLKLPSTDAASTKFQPKP